MLANESHASVVVYHLQPVVACGSEHQTVASTGARLGLLEVNPPIVAVIWGAAGRLLIGVRGSNIAKHSRSDTRVSDNILELFDLNDREANIDRWIAKIDQLDAIHD